MTPSFSRKLGKKICVLMTLAITVGPSFGQGETVNIYLKGNRYIKGEITALNQNNLSYQTTGTRATAHVQYTQIEIIQWPEPKQWKTVLTLLEQKKYDQAIPLLIQFTRAPQRFTKHPAPGNFSTRARRKLLDAYRATMDGPAIKAQLTLLRPEISLLPPRERRLHPAYDGWIAATQKNWNAIYALAEKHPGDAEIAYLTALAHQTNGNIKSADHSFTKAYTLDSGGNTAIARVALRESILIQPTSTKVHTWATLFGKGSLWENAPATATALLAVPLHAGAAALGERNITADEKNEKTKRLINKK